MPLPKNSKIPDTNKVSLVPTHARSVPLAGQSSINRVDLLQYDNGESEKLSFIRRLLLSFVEGHIQVGSKVYHSCSVCVRIQS